MHLFPNTYSEQSSPNHCAAEKSPLLQVEPKSNLYEQLYTIPCFIFVLHSWESKSLYLVLWDLEGHICRCWTYNSAEYQLHCRQLLPSVHNTEMGVLCSVDNSHWLASHHPHWNKLIPKENTTQSFKRATFLRTAFLLFVSFVHVLIISYMI